MFGPCTTSEPGTEEGSSSSSASGRTSGEVEESTGSTGTADSSGSSTSGEMEGESSTSTADTTTTGSTGNSDSTGMDKPDPVCGNNVVEPGEQCDQGGMTAKCDEDCTWAGCGDGVLNPLKLEGCDDGNKTDGDKCSSTCQVEPFCGDGNLDPGEECDDGNNNSGDACEYDCTKVPFPCDLNPFEPGSASVLLDWTKGSVQSPDQPVITYSGVLEAQDWQLKVGEAGTKGMLAWDEEVDSQSLQIQDLTTQSLLTYWLTGLAANEGVDICVEGRSFSKPQTFAVRLVAAGCSWGFQDFGFESLEENLYAFPSSCLKLGETQTVNALATVPLLRIFRVRVLIHGVVL